MRRLSPRQLRRLQARMLGNLGLDLKELGKADQVIIRFPDKEIILEGPNVLEMKVENESIYQIVGGERVEGEIMEEAKYEPSEEDVALVAAQAGVSEEEARNALIEAGGDLAKAILILKSRKT
ncbi:MAG: hypothetical protein DRN61_03130 [Thaumarchaeota archaeon]|nr:MAG: hypothetical protein DRN61_03130 [Nitrososphaerota archaeon]RLG04433.1 MAG: hypothetical protein DRN54_00995 [Nitrososphaerota archaeon]